MSDSIRVLMFTGLLLPTLLLGISVVLPVQAQTGFAQATDGRQYFSFEVDESRLQGAPIGRDSNRALTSSDRIVARNGHFYRVGADLEPGTMDDQRVKFFGANLSFSANFPSEGKATNLAVRLRKAGFNAVRLHHLDFHLDDSMDQPRGILGTGPYPSFNPEAIRRLRTLIAALSREGIYINLNLRVGYRFRPEIDNLPPLDDDAKSQKFVGSPIHVYYPSLITRQETYARELIKQLDLVNNPVLAMVEINNESSLLHAWQSKEWQDTIPTAYAETLQKEWEGWLLNRHGSVDAACRSWSDCDVLPANSLPPYSLFSHSSNIFPQGTLARWQTRIGLSTRVDAKRPRHRDFLLFLTEMDKRYLDRMKAVVQEAAGRDVPVTGTQILYGGVLNFDSHANMDYIDEHVYIGHPVFNGPSWQSEDWYIPDIAISATGIDALLNLSLRRVSGKPFVISEFNQPFPNRTGAEILPMMAILGALQDWDGIFFYGYSDAPSTYASPNQFSLSGDWGKYAFSRQSAKIFRQALLPALPIRTELPFPAQARLSTALDGPIRSGTLEARLGKVFKQSSCVAWKTRIFQNLNPDNEAALLDGIISDSAGPPTPFVIHNRKETYIRIVSPEAYGFFGRLGSTDIHLNAFRLRNLQRVDMPVSLLMTPLDDQVLSHSSHILLTLAGFTTGSQPGSLPKRPKTTRPYLHAGSGKSTLEPEPLSNKPSGLLVTRPPAWIERTPVGVLLPYSPDSVTVYPLDGTGRRRPSLPLSAASAPDTGTYVELQQTPDGASIWYELVITSHGANATKH